MKRITILGIFATILTAGAHACPCNETTTETMYESVQVNTVEYTDDVYTAPQIAKPARVGTPCARVKSSADLNRGCARRAPAIRPIRVKKYTEVIDHYQEYQPVVHYVPAGTHTTRRVIEY